MGFAIRLLKATIPFMFGSLTLWGMLLSYPYSQRVPTEPGDFAMFMISGRAALEGANPYATYRMADYFNNDIEGMAINLNPPVSLLVFAPLSRLEPLFAFKAWYLASLLAFVLVVVMLLLAYPHQVVPWRIAWMLSIAGLWEVLCLGQVYVWITLGVVTAWLLLSAHHSISAGIVLGLIASVKPNLVVWPMLLLIGGYSSIALTALITMAVLCAVSVVAYGSGVYLQWAEALQVINWYDFPNNASLTGIASRVGATWIAPLLSILLLTALAIWVRRARPNAMQLSSVALASALLSSPLATVGFTLILLPVLQARRWSMPMMIGALLLVVPFRPWIFHYGRGDELHLLTIGSIYSYALILVFAGLVLEVLRDRARYRETGLENAVTT